jgi:ceramide glucosyltransferase
MATAIAAITTLLTVAGLAYLLLALWATRAFAHYWMRQPKPAGFAPDVSILKPVKGIDARMYEGFASHCRQRYAGRFEIVFGVGSMDEPAIAEIERLRTE